MQSGNGIDLAAVYQLLTEVVETVRSQGERLDRIDTHLGAQDQVLNQLVAVVNEHTRQLDQLVTIVNEHSRKIDDLAAGLNELRCWLWSPASSVSVG